MPPRPTCRAFTSVTTLCAVLALLISFARTPCAADELGDFNAAVEQFASHNRAAIGYLRTGNVELASVEIDRLKKAWTDVVLRFSLKPPEALKENPNYQRTLADIQKNIGDAGVLMGTGKSGAGLFGPGRGDLARAALQSMREQLTALRKESKITVLADCVLDANVAFAAFFTFEYTVPEFSKPDIPNKAAAIEAIIKRCDAMADPATRANPEFRRLIDGTVNSLSFVPKLVETRDREMLQRIIGEMRAFDNLLSFRYG